MSLLGAQGLFRADGGDDLPRIGVQRPAGDILVPGAIFREDLHRRDDAVGLGRIEQDRLPDGRRGGQGQREEQWRKDWRHGILHEFSEPPSLSGGSWRRPTAGQFVFRVIA